MEETSGNAKAAIQVWFTEKSAFNTNSRKLTRKANIIIHFEITWIIKSWKYF